MSWKKVLKNQRPDYPDLDGDGDKEEPMVDALQTVEEVESTKKGIEKFFRRKPKKANITAQKYVINGVEVSKEIANLVVGESEGAVKAQVGGTYYNSVPQNILDKYMKDYDGAMQ